MTSKVTSPRLIDLKAGDFIPAGLSRSTILPDIDFETYSEAGFIWSEKDCRFHAPPGAIKKGLPSVGIAAYATHPSTEVLSMAYDLKDGGGKRLWMPENVNLPFDLLSYVENGGILEAWNSPFEYWIWQKVCVRKYGFPHLSIQQIRDAAAKSRAFGFGGGLDATGEILNITNKKLKDGKRLIEKFSIPRNPTKTDIRTRITPQDDPQDAQNLYNYNLRDIEAEAEISSLLPDLNPIELEYWKIDQKINYRGVKVDRRSIINCLKILEQAKEKYNAELIQLTDGFVKKVGEIAKIRTWLQRNGLCTLTLDADNIEEYLKIDTLPDKVLRVLEIRKLMGSASVSKLYAMINQMTQDDRLHELFVYHSARTGRAAGRGVQPQNLPNHGMSVDECSSCKHYFNDRFGCPWCGNIQYHRPKVQWSLESMEDAFKVLNTGSLACAEHYFKNAVELIGGCLRGMFIAKEGHDLICSDFSAIEAVVLAELAGERWQQEVFRTHGMIYEMTAAMVSGLSFGVIIKYKENHGKPHELRRLGKVAALASGYGGWLGAWKAFGADQFLTEEQIKEAILAWRNANQNIVNMWAGLEFSVIEAIMHPGIEYRWRSISYRVVNDVLYCKLPSCRCIVYHRPRLQPSDRPNTMYSITFEGWNTNIKYGAIGWIRMQTYGGKLTENVVQATARDILTNAIVTVEQAGYPVVLHVHDEIVAEIPENFGSIEDFEEKMSILPFWAKGWPVKAVGGWRAKRYGK